MKPDLKKFLVSRFEGQSVYIVGGGPSLAGFDFSVLDSELTIAVNHSYEYCSPDLIVYIDNHFLKMLSKKGTRFDQLPAPVLKDKRGPAPGDCYEAHAVLHPKDVSDTSIYGKISSGAFAISAALLGGAKRVYLLGFDCHADGGVHFYDGDWASRGLEHPAFARRYENMMRAFDLFEGYGAERVTNLSPTSKISVFEKQDWRDHWPQNHAQKRAV